MSDDLRKILVEAMSRRAEKMSQSGFGCSFKPGVGDKLLFNRIIDGTIAKIREIDFRLMQDLITNGSREEDCLWDFDQYVGISLMRGYYCPQYGEFDRQELERAREEK